MARTTLSGFPEWLPEQRIVEQRILEVVASSFELFGYTNIETRSIEPLETLMSKGETSKEVYRVSRLNAPESDNRAKQLGLRFDLTVPFARYVLENAAALSFPFKRYQIQKVWRGERPQDGRAREFTQADIDVVGQETLPFHYEVEVPLVMAEAFARLAPLGLPPVRILANNRKLSQGFYTAHGITNVDATLRIVDKLNKIGPAQVGEQLVEHVGLSRAQADAVIGLAQIRGSIADIEAGLGRYSIDDELYQQGHHELLDLLEQCERLSPGVVQGDLAIARGLDYYTGSVYESVLVGHENLGSICSGGRYDSLASDGRRSYPGVGMSIGITRILMRIFGQNLLVADRSVPTVVLVALEDEESRPQADMTAKSLRDRGIPTEVAPAAARYGKQLKYAIRRNIPFVYFTDSGSIKDIRTAEQVAVDILTWSPDEAARRPQINADGAQESV